MSKIDSDIVKPNLYPVDLDELVKVIHTSYSVIHQNKKVEFKVAVPDQKLSKNIVTDGTKLKEIITNLLNNAFKFTEEGYVLLEYNIDEVQKRIVFNVKDSGIGIPDEFQKNIFKRFSKINAKGISANEGLGLGLAISKAYVEMLGGKISFESQAGVGTVFSFYITLQNDGTTHAEKPEQTKVLVPVDVGNEKIILVAEDDNINFILLEKL